MPRVQEEKGFDLMLGYACNIKCRFCSQELGWREAGWISLSLARERIYAAFKRGRRTLNILGGEATIYPHILEVLLFARRVGFETIQFETNGIRLSDFRYASMLARAGLTRVSISIHGHSPDLHDHLVKMPGAFEKLIRGIDNFNKLGVAVRSATVITKKNAPHLGDICKYFIKEKKLKEFQFIYPLYTGDYINHLQEMAISFSEAVPHLEKAFASMQSLGVAILPIIHNIPPCFFPKRLAQMGDWHDLGMEILKPDGKEYTETLETPLYRKSYVAVCQRCPMRQKCVGIDPEYLRYWGDREIKVFPREFARTSPLQG